MESKVLDFSFTLRNSLLQYSSLASAGAQLPKNDDVPPAAAADDTVSTRRTTHDSIRASVGAIFGESFGGFDRSSGVECDNDGM